MELKLVYRGLRQVSDWALRFYSDIYVDGQENIPHDGPLIIASSHHNEILDIATLSITIPHRRPVCFWAKSTMFKNPLVCAVLLSSGSIPVARNPNSTPVPAEHPGGAGPAASPSQRGVHEALFRETFRALEREEVIGVFPEGTSYTEPCIAQVKDGASRAALEYVKWVNEGKGKHKEKKRLLIVPVGIVYTDKSQYQSRLCVRYGKAIDVEAFAAEKMNETELQLDSREVVRALSAEIEKRLIALTINAPDWATLYAVQTARDILWADEEIPASHFVSISQNLVDLFADPQAAASCAKARHSLLKYHSLLYYTNISHSSLNAIYPAPSSSSSSGPSYPSGPRAFSIALRELFISVLHPRFALFLPTLILHVPAYVTGLLADRLLGNPEEEETHAQFKAVLGGLAATAAYAAVTRAIVRGILKGSIGVFRIADTKVPGFALNARWLFAGATHGGKARAALGAFGIFYVTSFVLSRWHNYWVGANYRQLKRLLASLKLFFGSIGPRSSTLTGPELAPYTTPYIPPPNPFIKRRDGTPEQKDPLALSTPSKAPSVSAPKLIRPLLDARAEATRNLWSFMVDSKYLHGLVAARGRDDAWMQVGPTTRQAL